jgi:hypothetical protein
MVGSAFFVSFKCVVLVGGARMAPRYFVLSVTCVARYTVRVHIQYMYMYEKDETSHTRSNEHPRSASFTAPQWLLYLFELLFARNLAGR